MLAGASLTLPIEMVKLLSKLSPPASVALTVMVRDDAASKSSRPFTTRLVPRSRSRLPGLPNSE